MKTKALQFTVGASVVALAVILAPAIALAGPSGGFGHQGWRGDNRGFPQGGAVVSLESSPYGPVLVVGGNGAGYDPSSPNADPEGYLYPPGSSLYTPTIDPPAFGNGFFGQPYVAGCNATTEATSAFTSGQETCTGSETDAAADWPALTTNGPPVAGPGVNPWLLGSVYRSDLGAFQVTYGGHPLYLFDPGPDSFFGEDFFETVGPVVLPWHTAWYLMSPDGTIDPGAASLSVLAPVPGSTDFTSNVLATAMIPNLNEVFPGAPPVTVAVYTFSADTPWHSNCYGACARQFVPLTTLGAPTEQAGVNASAVGVIRRADGLNQVTYHGQPLYIYNQEAPLVLNPSVPVVVTVGNGNGVSGFGGTLSLVSP